MSDYLYITKEVEKRISRRKIRIAMKELGYTFLYYAFGAYLPYSLQKKLFKESLEKYHPIKSTFVNSCILIGISFPFALSSGDVTISYQSVISWRYVIGFSFSIPSTLLNTIGYYALISNLLRIIYTNVNRKRIGDVLGEGIDLLRRELPRIIVKYFSKEYEKEINEELEKAFLLRNKRGKLEEKRMKIEEEMRLANERYFKKKYERMEA